MLIQAAGLAVLAALSPTALLVAAVYLGSARPRLTATVYLAGAVLMSLITGVVIVVVLRSANLNRPDQHTPRYDLRLGLGILLLAVAAVLAQRRPRPPDPAQPQRGLVSKLVANPGPLSAFLVGLLIFAPGVTFLAAPAGDRYRAGQRRAHGPGPDHRGGHQRAAGLAAHHALPDRPGVTTRYLTGFNAWLRAHGKAILVWVLIVAGAIMIGNGIYGLAVVR